MTPAVLQGMPYTPGWARGRLTTCIGDVSDDAILVIAQQDLAALEQRPAGLIVVDGAPFSHAMIGLLSWGIPVIVADSRPVLPQGAQVVLDGVQGALFLAAAGVPEPQPEPAAPSAGRAVHTIDEVAVHLRASVANAPGAARALARGAAAIGLVRSEFFSPPGDAVPDEAYFAQALGAVCLAAAPLAVTVRLVDYAADKRPPWLTRALSGMAGPLGMQGARLYDQEPVRSVVRAEAQALGRLARDYELSLLVPYVASAQEFRRWRHEITHWLPAPIEIGSMVETPAAALAIDDLLHEADFVALGCNDLMQCLFAVDRDIPRLARLLDPYAPVLYRFLGQVARTAGAAVQRVQVCGLLAQLPGLMPVMLGLGYRVFSVEPALLPYLADTISRTDTQAAASLARAVCAATNSATVRDLLTQPAARGSQASTKGARVWV